MKDLKRSLQNVNAAIAIIIRVREMLCLFGLDKVSWLLSPAEAALYNVAADLQDLSRGPR